MTRSLHCPSKVKEMVKCGNFFQQQVMEGIRTKRNTRTQLTFADTSNVNQVSKEQ